MRMQVQSSKPPPPGSISHTPGTMVRSFASNKNDASLSKVGGTATYHDKSNELDDDIDALFVKETYKNLTSVSRPLLKEMTERFVDDPAFRERIRLYLHPPRYVPRPSPTFRFMDLPVEIRVQIAQHALYFPRGLEFRWKTSYTDKRIAHLAHVLGGPLYEVCGLTRVSRQIRAETWIIPYKVNEIMFGCAVPPRFKEIHVPFSSYYWWNFEYFKSHIDPGVLTITKSIAFQLPPAGDVSNMIERMEVKAKEIEGFHVRLEHSSWEVLRIGICAEDEPRALAIFMKTGHEMEALVACTTERLINRAWRLFPQHPSFDEMSALKRYLSPQDYAMALDWINHGL